MPGSHAHAHARARAARPSRPLVAGGPSPTARTARRRPTLGLALASLLVTTLAAPAPAGDWPTFRNGPDRLGSTDATFTAPLALRWTYQAPSPPRTSWTSAEGRVIENQLIANRVKYDDAIHPVVAGRRVYFGSSVDHHLHCHDLTTGEELWAFPSGGPIRLAPTVADGRVYFGSDDGHAYCLSAEDGSEIWGRRAGPADESLLARGEMISRWPVRTGVLIFDGVAYFGAGIFPHEDIFLYAVNADDGAIIWRQDHLSELDGGRNDLSPQGYMLATDDHLIVPSGRTLPAVLDRRTGDLLHKRVHAWRSAAGGVIGGFEVMLADGQIYASGEQHWLAMTQEEGNVGFGWFEGRRMIIQGDDAYVATGSAVARLDRLPFAERSRVEHRNELEITALGRRLSGADSKTRAEINAEIKEAQAAIEAVEGEGEHWRRELDDDAALLAAGNLLFVGGDGRVSALDRETGATVWQAEVDGEARSLAAASDHLIVGTNTGQIIAFASAGLDLPPVAEPVPLVENPFPDDGWAKVYETAAEEFLERAGSRVGFALVVGNEEGRLAFELARRSDLTILAVEPDAGKVRNAREALKSTGLYGNRIVIHHGVLTELPYSNYFANLIVSDSHLRHGTLPPDPEGLARHLKPLGGTIVLGGPGPEFVLDLDPDAADAWLDAVNLSDQSTKNRTESYASLTRGALPGAGNWSHQYGSPNNTAVNAETRIKGGLGVLWYGDPGPGEMVNRHEGAVGPLSTNGRLFVQGEHSILAYDAYNGTFLWRHENPEALRTGVFQNNNPANLAATDDRLYHFVKDQCLELDAATGETVRVHRLPEGKDEGRHEWGYMAVEGDYLVGAASVRKELEARQRRRGRQTEDETDMLFAIDLETGEIAWTYGGQHIAHQTVAMAPDRVFFIDSSITGEQREAILRNDKSDLEFLEGEERERAEQRAKDADIRRAVALDIETGEEVWSVPVDVTDCSDIGIGGGKLTLMVHDGVILLGGANANGHYWSQFVSGEFDRRRLVALSAQNGYKLWAKDANYKGRPIILGDQVLAEPWSYDLQSGEQRMREHPLTGEEVPWSLMRTGHHCGILTGCDSGMLMFRSGDTAFYDMETDTGTQHFAGHRLGCWINAIPANGLVMIPEASAGCVCLFSIASTIVLEPRESRRDWAIHSAVGAKLPVKSMAVNLGAPGDRKDADGNLWLSFPRRKAYKETSLDLDLGLDLTFLDSGRFDGVSEASTEVKGTDLPWIYTSWAEGIDRISIPLLGEGDGPGTYTVRLHFAGIDRVAGQTSVTDVLLQGEPIATELTLDPDDPTAIVREVEAVKVTDNLVIAFAPKRGLPRLCAIEVRREDTH